MALAQSVRETRKFHSAFALPARSLSAGGFLASGQRKVPGKPARAPLARAAAGADGLFDGQRFVLTLEVTEGKQAQAADVLASGRFRATVLPDLPAPAGFRDFLQLPLSLLPLLSSSSSSLPPTSSFSPPTTASPNFPASFPNSPACDGSALDASTLSPAISAVTSPDNQLYAGNQAGTGNTAGSQAILKDPDSSVAAQAIAQVLTVAAQVKTAEAVRQQMVEKAVQVAGGREGSTPGALLLLSGAHPMRSWPLVNRLMPTNSLHMLRDAHRLRSAGRIPRCVQLWAVENPITGSINRLEQKLEAGAEAIILQPPVVPEAFQQWWCAAEQRGLTTAVPMVIGVPLITSARNLAFWMLLTDTKGARADAEIARFRQAEEAFESTQRRAGSGIAAGMGEVDVDEFRAFRQRWTENYLSLAKQLPGTGEVDVDEFRAFRQRWTENYLSLAKQLPGMEVWRKRGCTQQVAGTGEVDVDEFRAFRLHWTEQYLTLAKKLKGGASAVWLSKWPEITMSRQAEEQVAGMGDVDVGQFRVIHSPPFPLTPVSTHPRFHSPPFPLTPVSTHPRFHSPPFPLTPVSTHPRFLSTHSHAPSLGSFSEVLAGASGMHFMPINPRGWKDLRRLIATSNVFSSL
ncbi:unnamed protein product [Closterium sp. Yama58-4]|nr:unnamed protein product [Closterium sp. Yama58-4]